MLCTAQLEAALPPGSHGSTFGGNPLASAAALATLETIEREGLIEHSANMGRQLEQALQTLVERHPDKVRGVRGIGLLQGLVLQETVDARSLLSRVREGGVLLTIAGGTALRFSPPLVVQSHHISEVVAIVDAALGADA
jgi:acetylornithine/N-succinyldiaminopimelate aminotransferase